MNRQRILRVVGITLTVLAAVAAIATAYALYAMVVNGRAPRWPVAGAPKKPTDCAAGYGDAIAFDAATGRTQPLVLMTTGCSKAIVAVPSEAFPAVNDGCADDWLAPQIVRIELEYLKTIERVMPVRFVAKSTSRYGKVMSYGDEVHVVVEAPSDATQCDDAASEYPPAPELWWHTPSQADVLNSNLTLVAGESDASTYFLERTDGDESDEVQLGQQWWMKSKCPDSIEHSHTYVASLSNAPIAQGGGGTYEGDVLYQGTLLCTAKDDPDVAVFVAVTYPDMKRTQ